MSHTRIIAYNTVVQTIGKAATVITSFFLFRAIARYLGVTGLGEYTTIFAWSNFLAILADLGFQIIIVRALSTNPKDKQLIASTIISMRTVVAIGVFGFGALITQLLPYPSLVKLGIMIGALATFWLSINSTLVGIFQANFRMDKAVLTDLIGRLITLGAVALVVSRDWGLIAIMGGYVIGNFVNLLLSYALARHYISIRFHFDWLIWQKYFKDALAFGFILIFAYIYFRIDAVLLSLLKSPYDVGIYGVSYKILEIMLFLPALFLGVVFPLFAKYGLEDRARLERIFYKSQAALIMVGLPITVGVIILARPIVQMVSGPEFLTAASVYLFNQPMTAVHTLQILMVAVFLSYLSHPYNYVLTANGYQQKLVWPNIFYAVFNIVLNIIFIPFFSYLAAAIITVLTEFLVLMIPGRIARQRLGLKLSNPILAKSGLSSLAMAAVVWLMRDLFLLWPMIVGASVYFMLLWLMKGLDREIVRELVTSRIR